MVNMAYMLSEGVDRREAIPIVPKASHDTGYTVYLPPMIREVTTCNSEMLVASGLVAGVAMCNFLCQLQILRAETKNQGSRTNMGQEDSTALHIEH